jgi:hypothetical protein
MRFIGERDLGAAAKPTEDGNRVVVRIGPHRFTASRGEAIELARQLVAAVDALALPGSHLEYDPNMIAEGNTP